jgi:hypothetical protein
MHRMFDNPERVFVVSRQTIIGSVEVRGQWKKHQAALRAGLAISYEVETKSLIGDCVQR